MRPKGHDKDPTQRLQPVHFIYVYDHHLYIRPPYGSLTRCRNPRGVIQTPGIIFELRNGAKLSAVKCGLEANRRILHSAFLYYHYHYSLPLHTVSIRRPSALLESQRCHADTKNTFVPELKDDVKSFVFDCEYGLEANERIPHDASPHHFHRYYCVHYPYIRSPYGGLARCWNPKDVKPTLRIHQR